MCRYFSFSYLKVAGEKCSSEPWRRLFWSFRALEQGLWPAIDPDGRPLGGLAGTHLAKDASDTMPFSAIVLFCKGDLEAIVF